MEFHVSTLCTLNTPTSQLSLSFLQFIEDFYSPVLGSSTVSPSDRKVRIHSAHSGLEQTECSAPGHPDGPGEAEMTTPNWSEALSANQLPLPGFKGEITEASPSPLRWQSIHHMLAALPRVNTNYHPPPTSSV